jgi:hypothetical protein
VFASERRTDEAQAILALRSLRSSGCAAVKDLAVARQVLDRS